MEVTFGPFRLDTQRRLLRRSGAVVELGGRAMDMLCVLATARGELVTKDRLMECIWPGQIVEDNTLQAQISAMRRALGDAGPRHVVTVPGRGYRFVMEDPATENLSLETVRARASIVVLPFANLSGDATEDYFADGMVEDIITALSRVHWLFVVARNSSFMFKNRTIDVRTLGQELNVRYVLEGSVRKAEGRLRVTAQLVEAETRMHVWADRFDANMRDIFAVQDQLTDAIVHAVAPTLRHAELERARRKRPDSLDAYDLYLRALPHWHAMTRSSSDAALGLLQQCLSLDPTYAPALALRSQLLAYRAVQGWTKPPNARHPEILRLSRDAVRCDPADPEVLASTAHMLAWAGGECDEATRLAERACALGPYSAFVWTQAGAVHFHSARWDQSVAALQRALGLDPLDPMRYSTLSHLAYALINQDDECGAIEAAGKAVKQNPDFAFGWRALAAALALAGRVEEGRTALTALLELDPGFCVADVLARTPRAAISFRKTIEGLRILGAP
jgi:TolB-like protein/Flp pilus assembly protein TadD